MNIFKKFFEVKKPSVFVSEADLIALRQRNEIRLEEAKQKLGEKWLLHPNNQIKSSK
jgi:hypothetical protein